MWGFERPEEERRGRSGACSNVGQLRPTEPQLCSPGMEAALSPVSDTPCTLPPAVTGLVPLPVPSPPSV